MNYLIDNNEVSLMDTGTTFDPNKHSVILLHGSGQSHIVWSLTTQYLSDQDYNVFAIDFPGHGNSGGQSLKTIEETALWLEKFLNKIGIENIYESLCISIFFIFTLLSNPSTASSTFTAK